jgi:hypothetical protein
MPPLGERFHPSTGLSELESEQRAEIATREAIIAIRMDRLTPPTEKKGRFSFISGKSAVAHYEYSDLGAHQIMEAFVERDGELMRGGSPDWITLYVRPVDRVSLKIRPRDARAIHRPVRCTATNMVINVNGVFGNNEYNTLGHAQKLEHLELIEETLELIAQAEADHSETTSI